MKKIRIMLLSILLIALLGGILAFKAKYHTAFCTHLPNDFGECNNVYCEAVGLTVHTFTDVPNESYYCWTWTNNANNCGYALPCVGIHTYFTVN
jgi:hypothetical protein